MGGAVLGGIPKERGPKSQKSFRTKRVPPFLLPVYCDDILCPSSIAVLYRFKLSKSEASWVYLLLKQKYEIKLKDAKILSKSFELANLRLEYEVKCSETCRIISRNAN
jgi:hypothetical protein